MRLYWYKAELIVYLINEMKINVKNQLSYYSSCKPQNQKTVSEYVRFSQANGRKNCTIETLVVSTNHNN